MTSIIHKYLYSHFLFVDGKIRTKSKYKCGMEPFSPVYIYDTLSKIIDELCLVFGMTKKELKYYVKGWVRKHNRGFHFEKYWNPPKPVYGIYFPTMRRIYSRTIGMDLARVEPMEQPRGVLQWGHFVGTQQEPEAPARYSNRLVDSRFYGTLNITPDLVVEENTSVTELNRIQGEERRERRRRLIELWEPLLHRNGIHL